MTLPRFQSTHPRGVRPYAFKGLCPVSWFQSTHPRGVRLIRNSTKTTINGFNPRTHEGCDSFEQGYFSVSIVSIHAPTRGATYCRRGSQSAPSVSIHAPTRGATAVGVPDTPNHLRFNPRTHEGCDKIMKGNLNISNVSIHAPTRGATHSTDGNHQPPRVSIHAPTRGATFYLFDNFVN